MSPTTNALIQTPEYGFDRATTPPLFAALYADLHQLARRELARRGFGVTIGATTLLHETYLDMAEQCDSSFPDRMRFMAYAARVMRGLIIDYARKRRADKRGGQFEITSMSGAALEQLAGYHELTRLSDALEDLARLEPDLAEIVDLKFFCGFSFSEIAAMRGVSERTVQRNWDKARIYLYRSIHAGSEKVNR
jgi:RNA polymerase sigma factor (TIGR02999 family)